MGVTSSAYSRWSRIHRHAIRHDASTIPPIRVQARHPAQAAGSARTSPPTQPGIGGTAHPPHKLVHTRPENRPPQPAFAGPAGTALEMHTERWHRHRIEDGRGRQKGVKKDMAQEWHSRREWAHSRGSHPNTVHALCSFTPRSMPSNYLGRAVRLDSRLRRVSHGDALRAYLCDPRCRPSISSIVESPA